MAGGRRFPLALGRSLADGRLGRHASSRSLAFQVKVVFFCWLQILLRWTYPRIRYDQLMDLGWKLLVPLGLLNILATGLVASL